MKFFGSGKSKKSQLETTDKSRLETATNEITMQVEDNVIKPESFSGSDFKKLQKAFDEAIRQNKALRISKIYNIGVNTITINKGSDIREPLFVFGGGKIIKDTDGYIFKGSVAATSDISFQNIWFEGVEDADVSVFDCGNAKLIRINTSMCYFSKIKDIFYSPTYLQDIKMNKDTIITCSGSVFNARGMFVVSITGITMENSNGQVIIKRGDGGSTDYSYNVIVKDSIIEGFYNTTKPLFEFASGGMILENNYFEGIPNGVIQIAGQGIVKIKDNVFLGGTNSVPFVKLGVSTYGISEITNNITPLSPTIDATNLTANSKVIASGNVSNFTNVDPNKKIRDISKDIINDSVERFGNQYHKVRISKSIPNTEKVDLCTFDFHTTSGGYITIKGGGIQGNVGVFGINKSFKITRDNNALTITPDTNDSWGLSSLQKENIFLEVVGNRFVLRANGRNGLALTQYDIFVEVFGYVNWINVH